MSAIHLSWLPRSFALYRASISRVYQPTGNTSATDQPNHLHPSPLKLIFQLRECAELCRADRCEVCWVRKEDAPLRAEPAMEVDVAVRCLCLEIGRFGAEA